MQSQSDIGWHTFDQLGKYKYNLGIKMIKHHPLKKAGDKTALGDINYSIHTEYMQHVLLR